MSLNTTQNKEGATVSWTEDREKDVRDNYGLDIKALFESIRGTDFQIRRISVRHEMGHNILKAMVISNDPQDPKLLFEFPKVATKPETGDE